MGGPSEGISPGEAQSLKGAFTRRPKTGFGANLEFCGDTIVGVDGVGVEVGVEAPGVVGAGGFKSITLKGVLFRGRLLFFGNGVPNG